jgi:predicted lipoprotein
MKKLGLAIIAFSLLTGCKKPGEQIDFDRGAMLTNISTSIIDPTYSRMETSLELLNTDASSFAAAPSLSTLNQLKSSFNQAYLDFEGCKMLNFGSMEDYGLVNAMNTYPTDSAKIISNISSGSYTLGAVDNSQAIGLPALDFLLFHKNESDIITEFTLGLNAANRKMYLTDLVEKMDTEFKLVQAGWTTSKVDFASADGNDIGSSTSLIFNAFVMDLELIKNAKIGIPAGFQTAGETLPQYVEAYYSEQSISLVITNLNALKTLFNGDDGIGFDDYVKDVEDNSVENSLVDKINAQFDLCTTKLSEISSPLSEKIETETTKVNDAYTEIKSLLTFIKTDMSSILGLLITFQDNDGD